MMTAAPPPPGFEELFAEFLVQTLALASPAELPAHIPPESWPAETARLVAAAGRDYRQRRQDREARLAANLAATAPEVTTESLPDFTAARIDIAPVADLRTAPDRDLCYVKINHGFWEQLYALFAPSDPARMRIADPAKFHGQYVASGFLAALAHAFETNSRFDGTRLRFPQVQLGVSLASGTHDHPDVLAGFAARSAAEKKTVVGAAIGLVSWWETLAPGRQPAFCDGSFPKRALATGGLRETLARAAGRSERIVFVVPGHLAGIRLADAAVPQETLLVPSATVHESWAAGLHAIARHVLGRLAADGRVLVITQSAVFAALLGLFLADAKRRLLPAASRLTYFDLGQVLDVAAPAAGGHWARTHATGDTTLFRTEPA
jgi:hypothetical protein